MQTQSSFSRTATRWVRRHWLALAVAGIATIAVLGAQPVWAASMHPDINQTVPPPTPRPSAPTPKPEDNSNNNNNNSDNNTSAEPTAAPTTEAGPAAALADVNATSGITAVVQAVTLNVRQGPGTGYPVAGKLSQGTVVSVNGRNPGSDWWYVCCVPGSGGSGWISAELVTSNVGTEQVAGLPVVESTAAPASATPVAGGKAGTVAAVTLNVRSSASTTAQVLGKLRQGDAVSVVGRNAAGDWLQVCCINGASGWVSAQYITPAFTAEELSVVETAGTPAVTTTVATTTTETATTAAASADVVTGTTGSGAVLDVTLDQQPPFAVQGKEIALVITIKNTGDAAAKNVALTNLLPAGLTLVNATASAQGTVATDQGAEAINVTWPSVAAGESVAATLRVKVAKDLANGSAFDEVATVTADNAEKAGTGITIGMPPSLLPEFW